LATIGKTKGALKRIGVDIAWRRHASRFANFIAPMPELTK
jgi:hypothetical protein